MSRHYIHFWTWFYEFGRRAAMTNDNQRLTLYNIYDTAYDQREKNPERALSLCQEGVAMAERLNEPWMALFYEYWIGEILIFYLARYEEGVQVATRLVAKASQPLYAQCPLRPAIFISMISAYYLLDRLSYVEEMQAMINTMEQEMPLDQDTSARLVGYRALIGLALGTYEPAMENALKYLSLCEGPSQTVQAYHVLCMISYGQNDDRRTLAYAHLMNQNAQYTQLQELLATSYLWMATLLALKAEPQEAERLFTLGMAEVQALNLPNSQAILLGTCRYYETTGQYEKSLAMWDKQIALMNPATPKRYSYFLIFLRRCFVMRKMGCLTESDIEQTRQVALRLHRPDRHLALINTLYDGQTDIPRY